MFYNLYVYKYPALGYLGIEINYLFIPLLIWAVIIIIHDIYKKEFRLTKNYSILMIIQGLIVGNYC